MYQCTLEVRGYELDSFNHVNNAVYLNYYEHARWEIMKESGIIEYFKKSGNFLVVVETLVKYTREIKLFDNLEIKTSINKKGPYLCFYHEMFQSGTNERVSKATVKTLLLDKKRTPIDIPEEFLRICDG
jgi:YbgC/YbaW family acyl-CoA thioester hydrolase